MKCKRTGCEKMSAKGQVYCSKDCAPYAGIEDSPTGSGPRTARSSTVDDGAIYRQPFDIKDTVRQVDMTGIVVNLPKHARDALKELPTSEGPNTGSCLQKKEGSSIAGKQQSKNDPLTSEIRKEPEPNDGIPKTQSTRGAKNMNAESAETLSTVSPPSLRPSSMGRPNSEKLLDTSIEHLHTLMLQVAPPEDFVDHRRVNAACSCARQLHNLMRLKLDAIRELKKRESE